MNDRQHFMVGILFGIFFSCGLFSLFIVSTSSSMTGKLLRTPLKAISPDPLDSTAIESTSNTTIQKPSTKSNAVEEVHFTSSLESLQKERQSTLMEACLRISMQTCPLNNDHVNRENLYSKTYKLSVCDIFKCGFSSWLSAVFVMEDIFTVDEYLAGKIHGDNVINLARKKIRILSTTNATEMKRNWEESFKVILVRNPFERIVSAYQDKLVPTGKGYSSYFGPMSKRINKQYRHMRYNEEERNKIGNGSATFEDFGNFLILGKSTDGHWQFYHKKCEPCLSMYDYIAKFETLSDDMNYLKKFLNISNEHQRAMFPTGRYQTSQDKVRHHFNQIPNSLTQKLYQMYKTDFDLFGYERPQWACED